MIEKSIGQGLGPSVDDEKDSKFETFTLDTGEIVHQIGLVQIWQRGYCDEDQAYADPPVFTETFNAWLAEHGAMIRDYGAFGPPWVVFPDEATAKLFEEELHRPGIQHFADYLNSDAARELAAHNRKVLGLDED